MHHLIATDALIVFAQQAAAPADGLAGIDWLWLVIRVFHLLSAAALVGGAIYLGWVLLPAVERHGPAGEAARLLASSRKRWAMLVAAAALLLIGSGFYSYIVTVRTFKVATLYHILFLVKFLLAMVVFFLASVLGGRTALADRFRQNAARWLSLIIWLSIAIVILATMLRFIDKKPKPEQLASRSVLMERI